MTGTSKERIFLTYDRRGPATWLGHLDMMRLFERAFSRAKWPVSWTEDAFNPRPELVFALPVGLGIETRADPLEVSLWGPQRGFPLDQGILDLNRTLPDGVRVISGQKVLGEPGSLMARVRAARYQLEAPDVGHAFQAVFQPGRPVEVVRLHKGKKQTIDLAPRLISLDEVDQDRLVFTGGAGSSGHLRLDLLLQALVQYGDLDPQDALGARIIRLAVLVDDKA